MLKNPSFVVSKKGKPDEWTYAKLNGPRAIQLTIGPLV